MRCPKCGNENPGTHRFCGMCGGSLLPPAPVGAQAGSSQAGTHAGATPGPSTPRADSSSGDRPLISGPSFLGLNQPPPRKRASLSVDPHSSKSVNLDYLLEDDDEPRSGTGWKFAVMIIALALAVGFGYLRWKNHGFDWLQSQSNKPSAQVPDETDSGSAPPNSEAPPTSTPNPPPASSQPSVSSQPPATSVPAPSTTPQSAPAGAPSSAAQAPVTNPAPTQPAPAPNTTAAGPSAPPSQPAASSPSPTADSSASDSGSKPAQDSQPAATQDTAKSDDDAGDTDNAPAAAKPTPVRKAPEVVKHVVPADPVAEAQKYIYGKGAAQDCDRGMRILKPAANQANAKAMVEMGALYSAGLCTPRDLPTAYRWFAMALRRDPENQSIQTDLSKLWGEMTQPERQLAIRLTQ